MTSTRYVHYPAAIRATAADVSDHLAAIADHLAATPDAVDMGRLDALTTAVLVVERLAIGLRVDLDVAAIAGRGA